MIQQMLAVWSLVPLPFLNPVYTSECFQFTNCWSLIEALLKGFEHYHASMWNELCSSLNILWHCPSWHWNENWPFHSRGHCWVFQICWHIECNTFTASSFRIWNSSPGIPSPPLALFIMMLPKAHFTLHSRMSGSRWVITPSWLSGSWRSFLYSSSVFLAPLLNIFSFC